MAGIRTSIELVDQMTAPLMNMINSANLMISAFQGIQSSSTGTVDTSEIEGAREQINAATAALTQMQDAVNSIKASSINLPEQAPTPEPIAPPDPMPAPIQWQSPSNVEVFAGNGMERYEQEIASVNQMLEQVNSNQQRISDLSNQTDVFPDNMLSDLQSLDFKIQQLASRIATIDNNSIDDIGADAASADVETLRNQLNQALQAQNSLTDAMEQMDISSANVAYDRLNNIIDSTDRHVRDNINEQDRFNQRIQQGQSMMDGLKGKIMGAGAAYALMRTAGQILNLSDMMSQTDARLNLIVDDGGSVDQLRQDVFDLAQRTRADYGSTANAVAQLGQRAGNIFSSNAETIQFVENLNKSFAIAGTSQQEMASATLQLTQALGSGVLRGEELNAVFEAAPNVIQTIADYLNVPSEKIREMASEGKITGEIVKNAMLGATDEIDAAFSTMPITFSQAWTNIQNDLLMTFQPLLQAIGKAAGWIHDNWATIEPVLWGLVAAAGAFALGLGIVAVAHWIATGAARTFFATLLSNPLTWIALVIGVLVAIIYKWVQSVGGIKIAWLIAMNAIQTAWDWVCIGFMTGVYWVLNLWDKMLLGASAASVAIQNFMGDMKAGTLIILQNMVNGAIDIINDFIRILNKIPGVSIDTIQNVTFGTAAQLENDAAKQARESDLQSYADKINAQILDRENALNSMKLEAIAATAQRQAEIDALRANAEQNANKTDDIGKEKYLPDIADNTKGIKDAVDISSEDLKYLRDLAEMEVVNRFTTAEITITQENHNNINSDMDVDGINDNLNAGLREAIDYAQEGVHV